MNITFRKVNFQDEQELNWLAATDNSIPALFDSEFPTSEQMNQDRVKFYQDPKREADFFDVALDPQGKIVGFHLVSKVPHFQYSAGRIDTLWVDPAFRNQGIAQSLKKRAEEWAQNLKLQHLHTWVHADNAKMISLNQSMGYKTVNFKMRKDITPAPAEEKEDLSLKNALQFIEALDDLKNTYRKCLIMCGSREESTAEHSFSLAMSVLTLAPFSNSPIDKMKTLKMALFHDLAEALLGDTFHYSKTDSSASEEVALKKMLTPVQDTQLANEILNLWKEFESGTSSEAVFLRGLDRFLPMYHNFKTKGHSWVKNGITKEMALSKNAAIEKSSAELWDFTKQMLDESQSKGWIG